MKTDNERIKRDMMNNNRILELDEWGFDVEIGNVPDLESFLRAVTLSPRAITFDFDAPQWEGRSPDKHDRAGDLRFRLAEATPALSAEG